MTARLTTTIAALSCVLALDTTAATPARYSVSGLWQGSDISTPQRHATTDTFTIIRFSPSRHRTEMAVDDAISMDFAHNAGTMDFFLDSTISNEEHRIGIGMGQGALAVNLFSGGGEDYARLDPGALQMDPYFFHGGARHDFDYRGLAADLAIGRAVSLQFALAKIDATGMDARRTSYAGFTTGGFAMGAFSVLRDDDPAAAGVALGYTGSTGAFQFKQVDHESGARYRTLELSRHAGQGRHLAMSFQSGRNPLFRDGDESRVMFRLGGHFGSPPDRLGADDTLDGGGEAGSEEAPSERGRGLAVLGGAVVAIGVVSSSGSSDKDSAIRIRGRDNAARQVLNRINPVSVRQNREHGGWIYRNSDGTYGYTEPVAGTVASVDIGPKSVVPRGTEASASYHTHGGPDPRYDNENFSPTDLLTDRLQQMDGYLGTPGGQFKLHEYRTGRIVVLGRINN